MATEESWCRALLSVRAPLSKNWRSWFVGNFFCHRFLELAKISKKHQSDWTPLFPAICWGGWSVWSQLLSSWIPFRRFVAIKTPRPNLWIAFQVPMTSAQAYTTQWLYPNSRSGVYSSQLPPHAYKGAVHGYVQVWIIVCAGLNCLGSSPSATTTAIFSWT